MEITQFTEANCEICGGHLRLLDSVTNEWSHDARADHDPPVGCPIHPVTGDSRDKVIADLNAGRITDPAARLAALGSLADY